MTTLLELAMMKDAKVREIRRVEKRLDDARRFDPSDVPELRDYLLELREELSDIQAVLDARYAELSYR